MMRKIVTYLTLLSQLQIAGLFSVPFAQAVETEPIVVASVDQIAVPTTTTTPVVATEEPPALQQEWIAPFFNDLSIAPVATTTEAIPELAPVENDSLVTRLFKEAKEEVANKIEKVNDYLFNADEEFAFTKMGVPEDTDGVKFNVVDPLVDEAVEGDKKTIRIYKKPRLIYKDSNNQVRLRAKDWSQFKEKSETELSERADGGYQFNYQLNPNNQIKVYSGDMELVGGEKISPSTRTWQKSRKNSTWISQSSELYPNVGIAFNDSGYKRQRVLTIKQKPTIDFGTVKKIIFWEHYSMPENSTLSDWNDKPIQDGDSIDVSTVKIKVPGGDQMVIEPAVMFDATNQEISLRSTPYLVKIDTDKNELLLGIQVATDYLNDPERVYPVTIDPTYYACGATNTLGCSGYLDYYYRQGMFNGVVNADDRVPVADASTFIGAGLFTGLYSVNTTEKYTREIAILFPDTIISKLAPYGTVTNAELHAFYLGQGLGTSTNSISVLVKTLQSSCTDVANLTKYQNLGSCKNGGFDYYSSASVTPSTKNVSFVWDLTQTVLQWQYFPSMNKGVILEPSGDWDGKLSKTNYSSWNNRLLVFKASEDVASYTGNDPYLVVTVSLQQPDLVDGGSSVSPSSVAIGGQLLVSVIEKNRDLGNAGTHNVRVNFNTQANCADNNPTTAIATFTVVSLSSGTSIAPYSISYTIPAGTTAGSYCVALLFDSNNNVGESTEVNNTIQLPVTVTAAPSPDLTRSTDTINNKTSYVIGDTATFGVTVKNQGNASAVSTKVYYYLSPNAPGYSATNKIGESSLVSLGSSATADISLSYRIPVGTNLGTNYFSYWIDGPQSVSESNEGNNQFASNAITISGVPAIVLSNFTIPDASLYFSGVNDTITVTGVVQNIGTADAPTATYQMFLKSAGGQYQLTSVSPALLSLPVGSSQNVTLRGTIPGGMPYLDNYQVNVVLSGSDTFSNNSVPVQQYYYGSGGGGGGGGTPAPNLDIDGDGYLNTVEKDGGTNVNGVQSLNYSDKSGYLKRKAAITDGKTAVYSKLENVNVQIAGVNHAGDPVNVRNGAFEFEQTDFALSGRGLPLLWKRTYNSKIGDINARLGNGWTSAYDMYYYRDPSTKDAQVYLGGALVSYFTWDAGTATFVPPKGSQEKLAESGNYLVYRTLDGIEYRFSRKLANTDFGSVAQIIDPNGNVVNFEYNTIRDIDLLTKITDASGRYIRLEYPADNTSLEWDKIQAIYEKTDGINERQVVAYDYDAGGNLIKVDDSRYYQGATEVASHTFTYDGAGKMFTYTDPRGTVLRNVYNDANGRVKEQYENYSGRVGGEAKLYTFSYQDVPDAGVIGSAHCTTVTSYRSALDTYSEKFCYNSDELKIYYSKGAITERWTYNANGLVQSYTDGNGNIRSYTYDSSRRLVKEVLPDSALYQTTVAYEYENVFNRLTKRTESYALIADPTAVLSTRFVSFIVDTKGNITGTRDFNGATEGFTYGAYGNVATYTNKNNFTTTYTYDALGNYRTREAIAVTDAAGASTVVRNDYLYDQYGNRRQMTDGNGGVWQYLYDSKGNLRQEINPNNDSKYYAYDEENHRTKETDQLGRDTVFIYAKDLNASLLSVTRNNGSEVVANYREYDWLGNVVKETDPLGRVVGYTYDAANRVAAKTDSAKTTTNEYYSDGKIKKETDSTGRRTDYFYDTRGSVTETRRYFSASGFISNKQEHDGFGRAVKTIDGRASEMRLAYDLLGNIIQKTDALGGIFTYHFDAMGKKIGEILPLAQTDASLKNTRGDSMSYVYDELGRVIKTINADNKEMLTFYDGNGNVVKIIDRQNSNGSAADRVTQYEYYPDNRKKKDIFADNSQLSYVYDKVGNVKTKTDQIGRVSGYNYDYFNRFIDATDPAGNITRYGYDRAGNKTAVTYPDGTKTSYTYNSFNQALSITDAKNGVHGFGYDAAGNKTSDTDKLGHATTFSYDKLGRVVGETNPAGAATSYVYDANNNRTSETVGGKIRVSVYDALNRLTNIAHFGGKTESTSYDVNGNVTFFTDGRGVVVAYRYDKLGRLKEKDADNFTVVYTYDNWNNLVNLADQTGATAYVYNNLNLPTSETKTLTGLTSQYVISRNYYADGQLKDLTDAAGRTFTNVYDSRGLLDKVNYGATTLAGYSYTSFGKPSGIVYGNGVATTYGYDALERATSIETKKDAVLLFQEKYGYDAGSNRTQMVKLSLGADGSPSYATTTYSFDNLDQLKTVDGQNASTATNLTYNYDTAGNRTSLATPFGTATYAYNSSSNELNTVSYNGGKLSIAATYDGNGSLTKEVYGRLGKNTREVNYVWNDENRLSGITYKTLGSPVFLAAIPDNQLAFAYDDFGNRVKKIVNGQVNTFYLNNGLSVLNEVSATGTISKSIVPGLSQIAEIDEQNKITYIHQDILGSTSLITDEAGAVVAQYEYDPFGQIVGFMESGARTNYLYTNQEFDSESNLYYYNARYYNPALGRFISRDPFLGRDGDNLSRNGYIYVKNNPLKYVDPTGEEEKQTQGENSDGQSLSAVDKALLGATGLLLTAGRWLSVGAKALAGKALGFAGIAYDLLRSEGNANAGEAELLKQCGDNCYGGGGGAIGAGATGVGVVGSTIVGKSNKIDISPNELVPTETPEAWKVEKYARSMEKEGFFSSKPVLFFEQNGVKYIVDGHHRAAAAQKAGIFVKALQVDENYLMKRFGGTAVDFMEKAFKFLGKIK